LKKEGVSTLKVAAAYIGTIVGAGFATGQEILQFFLNFGVSGIAGIIMTTIMFIVFGYIIMDLGKRLNAHSHLEIIKYSGGRFLGLIIDLIITFFLFGALTAMIAGTGALFEEQFNIPSILGNIFMCVITALTVMRGTNGVINSISFVVPFLLITVAGTSIYAIISTPYLLQSGQAVGQSGLMNNWLLSAILYVSYNTIISIAVLGPLGVKAKNHRTIRNGAILGGLGLGLGSMMIFLALSSDISDIRNLEIPMIYIAGRISPLVQIIYAVVLIAEVYTTAVGALFGFTSRLTNIEKEPHQARYIIIISTIVALIASQFGFSNLVKYLYPLVGYGGILLLGCLLYVRFKRKFS